MSPHEARGDGLWKLCAGMALGGACALRAYGKAGAGNSKSDFLFEFNDVRIEVQAKDSWC